MFKLFKHKTKQTDATPEVAVPADRAQSVDVVQATPETAATSPPESAMAQPADTAFWSYTSTDDDLIRVEETWQDGALVVRAELPGIDPDRDVRLTVVDGRLVIEAERHQEDTIKRDGYVLEEQRYSMFRRALPLRDDVDSSSITASYNDGVLAVRIPMPAQSSTKPATRIPVTT